VNSCIKANDQLTDGGPSVTLELPSCVAGPPFGAAHGWAVVAAALPPPHNRTTPNSSNASRELDPPECSTIRPSRILWTLTPRNVICFFVGGTPPKLAEVRAPHCPPSYDNISLSHLPLNRHNQIRVPAMERKHMIAEPLNARDVGMVHHEMRRQKL